MQFGKKLSCLILTTEHLGPDMGTLVQIWECLHRKGLLRMPSSRIQLPVGFSPFTCLSPHILPATCTLPSTHVVLRLFKWVVCSVQRHSNSQRWAIGKGELDQEIAITKQSHSFNMYLCCAMCLAYAKHSVRPWKDIKITEVWTLLPMCLQSDLQKE